MAAMAAMVVMAVMARSALTALIAITAVTAPPAQSAPVPLTVPDTMAQRLLACTTCHGKEGRASNTDYFPRIAGKPAGYLYNQLVNFRERRRGNATMAYFVDNMSDGYLQEIAEHFAALDLPYPPPPRNAVPAALLARGEALVLHGDAQRQLPACVSCHGSVMTGVLPAVPGLLGLPRAYLAGQLGAWRSGQRKATAPDCMADIARRLSATDVTAAVSWLAAQPVPTAAKAASAPPASSVRMACGSMPAAR